MCKHVRFLIRQSLILLGFAENQGIFWNFKIHNSVWITDSSDNGDSDNRGLLYIVLTPQKQDIATCMYYVLNSLKSLPVNQPNDKPPSPTLVHCHYWLSDKQ